MTIKRIGGTEGQIVVGCKRPETRIGIDVTQKYEEIYNLIKYGISRT